MKEQDKKKSLLNVLNDFGASLEHTPKQATEAEAFDQSLCSRLTLAIVLVTVLSNSAYSIVAPFLPLEFA
jgi:hypothetical protein